MVSDRQFKSGRPAKKGNWWLFRNGCKCFSIEHNIDGNSNEVLLIWGTNMCLENRQNVSLNY